MVTQLGWVDPEATSFDDAHDVALAVARESRKAERLLAEARAAAPRTSFEPAERAAADGWAVAAVELPAVHVRGSFVLWRQGLPPHVIYPALAPCMPRADLGPLVGSGSDGGVGGGSVPPGATRRADRDRDRRDGGGAGAARVQCVVVELGCVRGLTAAVGAPLNPYLVAELGGQRLVTQPLLHFNDTAADGGKDAKGKDDATATFNERFVVFLDGTAPVERATLRLRLLHKQAEGGGGGGSGGFGLDAESAGRQSIGGPPHVCCDLHTELEGLMEAALGEAQQALRHDWERERERKRRETGLLGSLMGMLGLGAEGGGADGRRRGGAAYEERPERAPEDLLLGVGAVDLGTALAAAAHEGGNNNKEVVAPLTLPVAQILAQRRLADTLAAMLGPKAAAAAAAEQHELVPRSSLAVSLAEGGEGGGGGGSGGGDRTAAAWAEELMGALSAELGGVSVPTGEATLRVALLAWDARAAGGGGGGHAATVAQQVPTPGTDRIALSLGGTDGGADAVERELGIKEKDVGSGTADNPYATTDAHAFLQYRWEAGEHADVERRVAELSQVVMPLPSRRRRPSAPHD